MNESVGDTGFELCKGLFAISKPLLVAVAAAGLISCGDNNPVVAPQTPTVTPANLEIVSGDRQTGQAGTRLPELLVVQVTDQQGNAVSGVQVTWQSAAVTPVNEQTDASGLASGEWTVGTTAGSASTTAQVAGLNGATFTANVTAGPPEKLQKQNGDLQFGVAGRLLTDSLVVHVTDAYGNAVVGATIVWSLGEGAGSVDPAESATDSTGHAWSRWTLGPVAGQNSVTANLDGVDEVAFTATSQAAAVQEVSGTLNLPEDIGVEEDELRVITIAESNDISEDGSFSVEVMESEGVQLLLFTDKDDGDPIFLGLHDPVANTVQADITSTALALTLLNPYMVFTSQEQRAEYLQVVENLQNFTDLLQRLESAYGADPRTALDYEMNPGVYQAAVETMRAALIELSGGNLTAWLAQQAGGDHDGPYIVDVPASPDIQLVNPRHVFYGAGIYPNDGDLREVVTVDRVENLLSVNWGWPPLVFTEPKETDYELGDGYYRLQLARGGDYTKFLQWETDPVGRATVLNTGQAFLYILELVVSSLPKVNIASLPYHIHINERRMASIILHYAERDDKGLLMDLLDIMLDNSEGIAYWIWQQFESNAAHQFLNSAAGLLKDVALVFKMLGMANEQMPFVSDLVFSPSELTYFVTQESGTITSTQENHAPEALFAVNPQAGVVSTVFTFDASLSSDDLTEVADLMFRWDWQGDGTWDTGWLTDAFATHSYGNEGAYRVILEVRDDRGLVGVATHSLSVGGGAGTATHVKLFRSSLPWDSYAIDEVLGSIGFRSGVGPNTYEIIGPQEMGTTSLVPGEDLVIISNDQDQEFYNYYGANQVRFTNFVYSGGSMFWEACDEGWAGGSMASAGIVLPGDLRTQIEISSWNYVVDPTLPLVAGLPEAMDHNYASHESFTNLPDGTTIYMVSDERAPTLVEYSYGAGWVIVTGQPLEHQYDRVYGAVDMAALLPRIVSYFVGADPQALANIQRAPTVVPTSRPSHERR